jgi:hypothetical protein
VELVQEQLQASQRAGVVAASDHPGEAQLLAVESQVLRAELQSQDEEHAVEVDRHRNVLRSKHNQELEKLQQKNDAILREELEAQHRVQEEASWQGRARHIMARQAEAEIARHREEAQRAEEETWRLRDEVHGLKQEHCQAAENWQATRRDLEVESEMSRAGREGNVSIIDQRLAAAQEDHARTKMRCAGSEKHLRDQVDRLQNELYRRKEELQLRSLSVQQREQELLEVQTELTGLQPLFNEVNQKLQSECGRVDKLHDAVQFCAKQSKELESLQVMLEDSHQMVGQVRTALENERAERLRTADLLEHEQQRTRMLLDVLRQFKEKLQGLTPQMMLSRLGGQLDDASPLLNFGASTSPSKCMDDFDVGISAAETYVYPSRPPHMN